MRTGGSARGKRRWIAAAVMAIAVLLAACGGTSGYTFVRSSETDAFFKVPSDWERFNKKEILVAVDLSDSPGANEGFKFLEAYDAAPDPSIDHVIGAELPNFPVVRAEVRQLTPVTRDRMSLQSIRNALFPIDELFQNDQVDVLAEEDVVLDGGVHGLRLDYNLSLAGNLTAVAGNQILRVTQIGLVDPATNLFYLFWVQCTADCFQQHQRTIDQIVDSYTVKEQ